jgi:HK97 family phage portal protein
MLRGKAPKSPGPSDDFWYMPVYESSKAGINLNEATILNYNHVFACVKVIAETIASLPLIVYKKTDDGKERAENYHLYRILHDQPNSEMTAFQFQEMAIAHLLTWGNAYAEIEFNGAGEIIALWPISPSRITLMRSEGGILYYEIRLNDGTNRKLPFEKVWHALGISGNGLVGYSPLEYMKEAAGLGIALEEFGARFFRDGTHPSCVVEHPGEITDDTHKNLLRDLQRANSGLGNAHRLMLLEEGMSWKNIGVAPEAAQFLESRKFQLEEIARIFRIPPHMVGALEHATFSNIEEQALGFVVHTIRPWLVRLEQSYKFKLIKQRVYFAEYLIDGLLRGNIKDRYDAYAVGLNNGFLCPDDVRNRENMNVLPDESGKIFLRPMNMVKAEKAGEPQPLPVLGSKPGTIPGKPGKDVKKPGSPTSVKREFIPLILDVLQRGLAIEKKKVGRIIKVDKSQNSLYNFYTEHINYMRERLLPISVLFAEVTNEELPVDEILNRFCNHIDTILETDIEQLENVFANLSSDLEQLVSFIGDNDALN